MDTTGTKATPTRPGKRTWRRHSDDFKAHVVALACQPGTSMAAVALANGLNANMLRRWVRDCELGGTSRAEGEDRRVPVPSFVQLPMAPAAEPSPPARGPELATVDVRIERGDTRIVVSLPLGSAGAAWLREVLG